jgi:hypothetical protein
MGVGTGALIKTLNATCRNALEGAAGPWDEDLGRLARGASPELGKIKVEQLEQNLKIRTV